MITNLPGNYSYTLWRFVIIFKISGFMANGMYMPRPYTALPGITRGSVNWNGRLNWNDGIYSALAVRRMYVKRYFVNDN